MSVAENGGGGNPAVNGGAPTPAATPPDVPVVVETPPDLHDHVDHPLEMLPASPGAPPQVVAQDYQDLDGYVAAHLGQLEAGWPVSQVARWQGEFLALLAGYPYSGGFAPHELITGYLHQFRTTLRDRGYHAERITHYLQQYRGLANAPGAPPHEGGAIGPAYLAVTGSDPGDPTDPNEWGMYRVDGDRVVRLCNFVLFIDEQVSVTDEIVPDQRLTGRVVMGSVRRPFTISTADYASNSGLQEAIYTAAGVRAQIFCKPEELRNAVAVVSTPEVRTLTTNFGWNATFDTFLMPSGGITATGYRPAQSDDACRVCLVEEEQARRLDLRPLDPAELARVRRHIAEDLLHVHDPRIVLVLLAAVALAVLHPRAGCMGRFAIWLTGLTGSGKTFLARLFQNFFGTWSAQDPLPSFAATINYLERQGYFFRNALYVIDDYKPNVTPPHHVVRLLQAFADGTGRGRLRSDATTNPTRPIRGLPLMTGEDTIEHTSSALARTVVVNVPNRPKDVERGSRCAAECAKYSGVTADFVRWILEWRCLDQFARRVDELRGRYYRDVAGDQNDARIAGNFAQLAAAGECMLAYLADVIPNAAQLATRFVEADLVEMRDAALADVGEEQESTTFLRILAELISHGRVQVEGHRARAKAAEHVPVIGFLNKRLAGRGSSPEGPEHFELSARACLEQVNQALARQGLGPLKTTEKALLRQLRHDGLLLDDAGQPLGTSGGSTHARRLRGQSVRCFRIRPTTLLGTDGQSSDGSQFGSHPSRSGT